MNRRDFFRSMGLAAGAAVVPITAAIKPSLVVPVPLPRLGTCVPMSMMENYFLAALSVHLGLFTDKKQGGLGICV